MSKQVILINQIKPAARKFDYPQFAQTLYRMPFMPTLRIIKLQVRDEGMHTSTANQDQTVQMNNAPQWVNNMFILSLITCGCSWQCLFSPTSLHFRCRLRANPLSSDSVKQQRCLVDGARAPERVPNSWTRVVEAARMNVS
eukprot:s168_g11.t1